jgi:hypothetical protein
VGSCVACAALKRRLRKPAGLLARTRPPPRQPWLTPARPPQRRLPRQRGARGGARRRGAAALHRCAAQQRAGGLYGVGRGGLLAGPAPVHLTTRPLNSRHPPVNPHPCPPNTPSIPLKSRLQPGVAAPQPAARRRRRRARHGARRGVRRARVRALHRGAGARAGGVHRLPLLVPGGAMGVGGAGCAGCGVAGRWRQCPAARTACLRPRPRLRHPRPRKRPSPPPHPGPILSPPHPQGYNLDDAYAHVTGIRPCGPRRDAIRAATAGARRVGRGGSASTAVTCPPPPPPLPTTKNPSPTLPTATSPLPQTLCWATRTTIFTPAPTTPLRS